MRLKIHFQTLKIPFSKICFQNPLTSKLLENPFQKLLEKHFQNFSKSIVSKVFKNQNTIFKTLFSELFKHNFSKLHFPNLIFNTFQNKFHISTKKHLFQNYQKSPKNHFN